MTHRIEPLVHMTPRIEPLFNLNQGLNFFQYDSKNWKWLTQRIEPSFSKWLKELSLLRYNMTFKNWTLSKYDSKNWMNLYFLNLTNWISFTWINELNLLFKMTQRIELSFLHDSKNWTFFFWTYERERETLSVAPAARSLNWSKLREPFDERSSSLINSLIHLWEDTSFVLASSCAVVAQCLVVDWWQTHLSEFPTDSVSLWLKELNLLF